MEIQKDEEVQAYVGKNIGAAEARQLAQLLKSKFFKKVDLDTLAMSVLFLVGGRLTKDKLKRLGWQLAARKRQLGYQIPLKPWSKRDVDEWVPFQILNVIPKRSNWGDNGADVELKALAGTPCCETVTLFWTNKLANLFGSKLGYDHKMRMLRVEELVGLRLYGLVEAAREASDLSFFKIDVSDEFRAYNRKIAAKRRRVNFTCPEERKNECYACPVGYDRCGLAVHPRTYVHHVCKVCGERRFTDPPSVILDICVDCQRKKRFSSDKDY